MSKARRVHFKTHSELKNIIGQDLINDDNIAIIELVKNGIDAGATKVNIEFTESAILIEDNGAGMAESDIENKWLNIAYSEKKHSHKTDRELAGNKGVGRFACDRLGSKLDLYSKKNRHEIQHLNVDWTAFEGRKTLNTTIQKIDIRLDNIFSVEMKILTNRGEPKRGTLLVISALRQIWNREKLLNLKRDLERFMNPIAVFENDSVEVRLIVQDELTKDMAQKAQNQINGVIQNHIFSKLKFNTTYIESKIDVEGKKITTALFHDGVQVYRLVEKNTQFDLLADVEATIHYMNPYKKAYFKRQTGLNLVEFGAVFLFINGYRVPPYGDRNNDWLKLDNRKTQGISRFLGNRELLGFINIKDPKNLFRIVSNREGLARDARFDQLTNQPSGFFLQTLSRLERFVVDGLDWDSVPEEVRKKLQNGIIPGDEDMPEHEVYSKSFDLKKRQIATGVLKIVGASPNSTEEIEIDPTVLDALSREREETVSQILEKFNSFEGNVGQSVKLALNRVQEEFSKQRVSLLEARKEVSRRELQVNRLKDVARNISAKKKDLEKQVQTQQTELHFARISSGSDQEQLLLLHHQSGIYANTIKNLLNTAIVELQKGEVTAKAIESIEKALLRTRKVIAVTNFATKANFKLKTESMTADIAGFIKEYLENVASDSIAQNLKVNVTKSFEEPFIMRFKPIDVAIIFDNLASNSTRIRAKNFEVHMSRPTENELQIRVKDDGDGLSRDIQPPESVFSRGVTTTNGSGLGLYHVQQTVNQLKGEVMLDSEVKKGFGIMIRIMK